MSYVCYILCGPCSGGGDTGASHSVQMPRQQPNPLLDPYGLKAAAELESIGSDSVDGLDDFEDVLVCHVAIALDS